MSASTATLGRFRSHLVGGAIVLASIVGVLVVQHLRHGWPFSLHHGYGAAPAGDEHVGHVQPEQGPVPGRIAVTIPASRAERFGLGFEPARRERIGRSFRAVATVTPDEGRVSHVHTRVSGWIERLYVRTTGESVRAGAPLASIFSQDLLATQNEYLLVKRAGGSGALAAGARERLRALGMTEGEMAALERRGRASRTVTIVAPRAGVILHRGAREGAAVDPSTEIVTIADLGTVWALAEVAEQDVPDVRVGMTARLELPATGSGPMEARVAFVYPTLSERTRTLRVRFDLPNPSGALRPGLYGTAWFEADSRDAVTVSRDAVVDTGERQHVFVRSREGGLEPRPVVLGVRLRNRVEVREGLAAGEEVVTSGVFLVDSESRLRASGGGTDPEVDAGHAGHSGHAGHGG